MPTPRFNRKRAMDALIYAAEHGDKEACEQFGITRRSLSRYRKRLNNDWELVDKLNTAKYKLDADWSFARRRFLNRAIEHLEVLIAQATVKEMAIICQAIKTVGDLEVVSGMLTKNELGTDNQNQQTQEAGSFSSAGISAPN